MQFIVVYDVMIIFRKDFLRTVSFQKVSEERIWQLKKMSEKSTCGMTELESRMSSKNCVFTPSFFFSLMAVFSFPSNLLSLLPNLLHKVAPHCLYSSPPSWLLDSRQLIGLPDKDRKQHS